MWKMGIRKALKLLCMSQDALPAYQPTNKNAYQKMLQYCEVDESETNTNPRWFLPEESQFTESQSQGGHSAHTYTGGQYKKFSGNPKISLELHCNPKISDHFILRNLYMNIKHPRIMQIEVRIASSEPTNIS